ncbi:hypothetical protein [Shewanella algae]|uniref:hypothetical protein n=1 Tax=Shewanella algae TaxID=38313 RepID=UPI000F42CAC2|nr:hypothetical protein [Shewanella algae]AYV12977.1 hypothetical protein EEY24_08810 [Shewanella algae]
MDALDLAAELEQSERAACIARARHRLIHAAGNGVCIDCLEPVETQRMQAQRCLSCQQDEDKRQQKRTGKRGAM